MYAFYITAELEYQEVSYHKERLIYIIKNVKILACGERRNDRQGYILKNTESKETIDFPTQNTWAMMVKGNDAGWKNSSVGPKQVSNRRKVYT